MIGEADAEVLMDALRARSEAVARPQAETVAAGVGR